ncbi:MAG: tRNA (adenosine(37)-N6)-dimethylallyltransferase MiaA [Desulfosarcina sp.]
MNDTREPFQTPKIMVVVGPTGAGKTGFAIRLARRFNGEIVGADSVQIYRFMDIGTAKPTLAEQRVIPHHMIDVVDPDQAFDAAAYAQMAAGFVHQIIARGRPVFVVGGTGLYIKALIHGLFPDAPSDLAVRRRLKQQMQMKGTAHLHGRLAQVDREAAMRIHPNDTYRIVRALEVFEVTGEPLTIFQRRHGFRNQRYDTLEFGLAWPRPLLYDRINHRVDAMLAEGFLEEVRQLLGRGYPRDLKSMQSLGYRHLAEVIMGERDLASAVTTLKRDHRRYAKRQMTWFGARKSIHWLNPDQTALAGELIHAFIRRPP